MPREAVSAPSLKVQGQAEWVPVQPDLVIGNAVMWEDWNWVIFEVTPKPFCDCMKSCVGISVFLKSSDISECQYLNTWYSFLGVRIRNEM